MVYANRLSTEVSCGRYESGSAVIPDLATGGSKLMEVRRQQPFQACCIGSAFQAQRLAFGRHNFRDLLSGTVSCPGPFRHANSLSETNWLSLIATAANERLAP